MKRELEGLRSKPVWVTHLGCIKGCLEYLGCDITMPWLYGGTGHAFIINMHEEVCPSGPTAWNSDKLLLPLGLNVGFSVEGVFAAKNSPDFAEKQEAAWNTVRGWIDAGIPCYGWELDIPEYYTVHGYDETGYYYWDMVANGPAGPKPWQELGDTGIGFLLLYKLETCQPAPDEEVVKAAFVAVLDHARTEEGWSHPNYRTGLRAFELWADALENGTASRFGQRFNAVAWTECRAQAVVFLKEAKQRLGGKADSLFDEALEHYSEVHAKLEAVSELHPFQVPTEDTEDERLRSPQAAQLIREARGAEEKGLEALQKIADAL